MVKKIYQLCKDRHMTVQELQRRAGINKNAIGRWDVHSPSVTAVKAVADVLGVTVDSLLAD